MILDYQCFLKDNLSISLPKFNDEENKEIFNLDVNFTVHFFVQLASTQQELQNQKNNTDRVIQLLKNIAVEILNLDISKHLTIQDIDNNFDDFMLLKNLFNLILNNSQDLYKSEIYKVPDLKVKRKGVTDSYSKLINYNDYEFMEGITLVMQQTANSFEDVMKMPYSCYLETIKQVRLSNLLQDDDWRKEYIKWKYKVEYKNGNIEEHTKMDLIGLKSLASML